MSKYNPSTISRLGDIGRGMLVETSWLAATAYMIQAQVNLFTVYNRILIVGLWGEVGLAAYAGATYLQFNWTASVPVISVQPLGAVCSSMNTFAVGRRVTNVGDAVGTATAVTASAGISYLPMNRMMVGNAPTAAGVTSVGQIGQLTSNANGTGTATLKFSLLYFPIDDGAYAEALL
jgi:hypothetical protein